MGWFNLSFRDEIIFISSLLGVAVILLLVAITCVVVRWKRRRAQRAADAEETEKMLGAEEPSGDDLADEPFTTDGDGLSSDDQLLNSDPVAAEIGSVSDLTGSKKKKKRKLRWKAMKASLRRRKEPKQKLNDGKKKQHEPILTLSNVAEAGDKVDTTASTDVVIDVENGDSGHDVTTVEAEDSGYTTLDSGRGSLVPSSYKSFSIETARQEIIRSGFKNKFASRATMIIELNIGALNVFGTVKSIQGLSCEEIDAPLEMCLNLDTVPAARKSVGYTTRWFSSSQRSLMTSFVLPRDQSVEALVACLFGRKKAFGKKKCYGEVSFPLMYDETRTDPVLFESRFLPKPSGKNRKFAVKF